MINLRYIKKLFLTLIILFSYPQLSHTLERFIPLELFTGGEIREDIEIKFTKADKIFSGKKRKKIVGLEDWKNPQTGSTLKFYKRTGKSQSGLKTHLFTVTNDGQCIGRVWDSRRGGRVIENGYKFPLEVWKDAETLSFKGSSGKAMTKPNDKNFKNINRTDCKAKLIFGKHHRTPLTKYFTEF